MSRRGGEVVVGPDGSLQASEREVRRRLKARSGEYELLTDTPSVIILRRSAAESAFETSRLIMAGEIVSRMSMLEVVNVIANANWRGELLVDGADSSERALTFDQGVLKYCRSNQPDDLLGEVLYRAGVIDQATHTHILGLMTPERRFGELCLELGIVDQERLFRYLQQQAEQIFYGALLVSDGFYTFRTVDDDAETPAHTVHVPIQGLLMEGVQRIDEMALFRERIRSSELCPHRREGPPPHNLDDTALHVLELSDGRYSINDIARITGLGEFLTTKAVYHLLQKNAVELHASSTIDLDAVRRLVGDFNEVMRDIFMAVATYGGVDNTRNTLAAWIQGSGYAPFFGEEVDVDGSISVDAILASVDAIESDHPVEALHQALHELAAFALFSATTTLPRDQELVLARDVNRRLKAIRI